MKRTIKKVLLMKNLIIMLILLALTISSFQILINVALKYNFQINVASIDKIEVINYNKEENIVELDVYFNGNEKYCTTSNERKISNETEFNQIKDKKCNVKITPEKNYIFFKNEKGILSKAFELTDYILEIGGKENYYLPLNGSVDISNLINKVSDQELTYELDSKIAVLENGNLKGIGIGDFDFKIKFLGETIKTSHVYVTDGITRRPNQFDEKKPYLPCYAYDQDKAKLMDIILEERINEVGYQTRAGAVEAARFLTLDFPYRLTYFFENGRVNGTGTGYADGEGRYYHKGLYLNEDKFSEIKYKHSGPAIWGCKLTNWEPAAPYYPKGVKLPNGLDCSGFVTWAILNGGFDVGDIGAGETPYWNQLTDKGDYTKLTKEIIYGDSIKVGDLFSKWGHISILVGQDEENFYIAESLDTLFGVVIKTYPRKSVMKTWTHIVYMDKYYKEDGKITDLWY